MLRIRKGYPFVKLNIREKKLSIFVIFSLTNVFCLLHPTLGRYDVKFSPLCTFNVAFVVFLLPLLLLLRFQCIEKNSKMSLANIPFTNFILDESILCFNCYLKAFTKDIWWILPSHSFPSVFSSPLLAGGGREWNGRSIFRKTLTR